MGARSAAGVAEVRVRVGTEVKATVGNTVLHQTIRPAFRYTRTAHIAVGTVGKAVLLQMIGAIRCQLPFSQAISTALGKVLVSGFISGVLDQRGGCIPISACPAAAGSASVWFGDPTSASN
jgi:hypothetical protein